MRPERVALSFLALLSVAPLLAWVFGLGSFVIWYWFVTVPALVLLAMAIGWLTRGGRRPDLAVLVSTGLVGGLLGTIGYDLVRVPFALGGLRLLAPIDSYGLLIAGAEGSDGWTGLAGWAFHFTNGICFGIAFAVMAPRRNVVWWAVAWAMVLETATIATPFFERYGLAGKPWLVVIAYGAHVAYGVPLGLLCRDPASTYRKLGEIVPRAALVSLAVTALALVAWHRPWTTPADIRDGEAVAPGPSAVVRDSDFSPLWLRVAEGSCVQLRNDDDERHSIDKPKTVLEPGAVTEVCIDGDGVHRLKIDGEARSGGFVLVDPEASS